MRRQIAHRAPRSLARSAADAIIFVAAAALLLFVIEAVNRTFMQVHGGAEAIDGDSLRQGEAEIRLEGIDAPEYLQLCRDDGHQTWPCGRQAAAFLRSLVRGKTVSCTHRDTDRHGRAVATCEADGLSLNREIVRQGWAIAYRRHSAYLALEEEARRARRGIWIGTFEDPETWRERERLKYGGMPEGWD